MKLPEPEENTLTTLMQHPKKSEWQKMNRIQKAGAIACLALAIPSFFEGRVGIIFGLASWTSLFLGYVAGALWKVRHAVHFWWSIGVAFVCHAGILPLYARLLRYLQIAPHGEGRSIISIIGALLVIEVLFFIFVLKRIALWSHRRHESRRVLAR